MEAFQQLVAPHKALPIPYSTCVPRVGQAPGPVVYIWEKLHKLQLALEYMGLQNNRWSGK